MGVGTGDGELFVHGTYESIKAAQAIVNDRARLQHNEGIYKEQIRELRLLLGQMVHRVPGTRAYNETRALAAEVVLTAHMSEYKPGEVANND
jgi:hypothetical protein